jgi:hypothetical protein
MSYF